MIKFKKTKLDEIIKDQYQQALNNAEVDEVVGISHAEISGDSEYRTHVASIRERVGCHFHKIGDEDYKIISGKGKFHFGKVDSENNVNWQNPIEVSENQSFTIPEGFAHQLENIGESDLIITFGCPDSHLSTDRTMVGDSPYLSK